MNVTDSSVADVRDNTVIPILVEACLCIVHSLQAAVLPCFMYGSVGNTPNCFLVTTLQGYPGS